MTREQACFATHRVHHHTHDNERDASLRCTECGAEEQQLYDYFCPCNLPQDHVQLTCDCTDPACKVCVGGLWVCKNCKGFEEDLNESCASRQARNA